MIKKSFYYNFGPKVKIFCLVKKKKEEEKRKKKKSIISPFEKESIWIIIKRNQFQLKIDQYNFG